MRRRYRQPTRHQRTPETLDTYSSLTGSSILRYKINWLQIKSKKQQIQMTSRELYFKLSFSGTFRSSAHDLFSPQWLHIQ